MTKVADAINSTQFEYTVTGINGNVAGPVTLCTTLPGTLNFYPSMILTRLTNVIAPGGLFSAGFGWDFPTYQNILSATGIGLVFAGDYFMSALLANLAPSVPPSTDLKMNITVPDGGVTYIVSVTVIGQYL